MRLVNDCEEDSGLVAAHAQLDFSQDLVERGDRERVQQYESDCAVTCTPYLCTWGNWKGRMESASLAPIRVPPHSIFLIFLMFIIAIIVILALFEL